MKSIIQTRSQKIKEMIKNVDVCASGELKTNKGNHSTILNLKTVNTNTPKDMFRTTLMQENTLPNPKIGHSDKPDSLRCIINENEMRLKVTTNKLNDALKENQQLSFELQKLKNQVSKQCKTTDKWLDDSVIQAYFSTFNESPIAISSRSLFVQPSTCELLKHSSIETITKELNSLNFESFNYAFLCINDSQTLEYRGSDGHGSHWSLLFLDMVNELAFHLDSLGEYNLKHALCLTDKLGIKRQNFKSMFGQKQNNNFECGLNVILNAKAILNFFCSNSITKKISFKLWYNQFANGFDDVDNDPDVLCNQTTSHCVSRSTDKPSPSKLQRNSGTWKIAKSHKRSKKLKVLPPCHSSTVKTHNSYSPLNKLPTEDPLEMLKNNRESQQKSFVHLKNHGHGQDKTDELILCKGPEHIKQTKPTPKLLNKFNLQASVISEPFQPASNTLILPNAKPMIYTQPNSTASKTLQPKLNTIRARTQNIVSSHSIPSSTRKSTIKKSVFNYNRVIIEGDSHARGLAELLQQQVTSRTSVFGMCKPGAKLKEVTADGPPPPGSVYILVAGSNDVAAGERASVIYQHLEEQLLTRLQLSTTVIISTLPHRHDLDASHRVNQRISLTNSFLEEMCKRHQNVRLLDFNRIGRRWFTQHGMHLRYPGKRVFVAHLLKILQDKDCATDTSLPNPQSSTPSTFTTYIQSPALDPAAEPPTPSSTPLPATDPSTASPLPTSETQPDVPLCTAVAELSLPFTLHHNSYSDAVTANNLQIF